MPKDLLMQTEEGHLQNLLSYDQHLISPPDPAQLSSAAGQQKIGQAAVTMGSNDLLREHMFDKVVTPSDVGKLNRLVIPKHHAQKYFPLDTDAKDKGVLLSFRDSAGKEWRFRYSYWSSSQSYVFTKGWSRFVREMQLHAGDVVSFHRATDARNVHQFYISWRRRASKAALLFSPLQYHGRGGRTSQVPPRYLMSFASLQNNDGTSMATTVPPRVEQANGLVPTQAGPPMAVNMFADGQINSYRGVCYGELGQTWVRELPPFVQLKPTEPPPGDLSYAAQNAAATGTSKRVRLFGVNL